MSWKCAEKRLTSIASQSSQDGHVTRPVLTSVMPRAFASQGKFMLWVVTISEQALLYFAASVNVSKEQRQNIQKLAVVRADNDHLVSLETLRESQTFQITSRPRWIVPQLQQRLFTRIQAFPWGTDTAHLRVKLKKKIVVSFETHLQNLSTEHLCFSALSFFSRRWIKCWKKQMVSQAIRRDVLVNKSLWYLPVVF